ncbi:hypothetical protein [Paenibacillus sp. YAF4_2]|uniref:hypothetical protein n=1 Tax=Paenibacillus sp. YAF4_2 TaxID=3233085 RepID=UPI003F9CD5AF
MPKAVTASFKPNRSGDDSLRLFSGLTVDDCICVPISVCIRMEPNRIMTGLFEGLAVMKKA